MIVVEKRHANLQHLLITSNQQKQVTRDGLPNAITAGSSEKKLNKLDFAGETDSDTVQAKPIIPLLQTALGMDFE